MIVEPSGWTQVIDTRDDIGWHWDRDYGKEEDGELVYPDMATVTYFSKEGGCTAVVKAKKCKYWRVFRFKGHDVEHVVLSKPRFGKQLYFDGRYLHGAPADFEGDVRTMRCPKGTRHWRRRMRLGLRVRRSRCASHFW